MSRITVRTSRMISLFALSQWLSACAALGSKAEGDRLARMLRSPQYDAGSGAFRNPGGGRDIGEMDYVVMLREYFFGDQQRIPESPLPQERVDPVAFLDPDDQVKFVWLGHSTFLLRLDDRTILVDPVFGDYAGPVPLFGRRFQAPLQSPADLPEPDVIVISHDHYDHLEMETMQHYADRNVQFVVPLGVGAHLEGWGVPASSITELDWWEAIDVSGMTLTCTPARHASGRQVFDQNRTLWAGYALKTQKHNVFFSGDTGLFPAMHRIGEELGPFDLAMVEVGAYDQGWPDWHIGPEQAVLANQWLKGEVFLPIHWGLFDLANHSWTEPMERVLVEAEARAVRVATPVPGGSFEPATVAAPKRWWPETEWRTAEAYPVLSTQVDRD